MLLLVVPLAPAGAASKWWNNDWAFRKQITLDLSATGADIAGTPVDVPTLIRLHPGNFTYFNDVQKEGADLRFVAADDTTALKYHIEKFDPVNQIALIWVRVPRLTGGTKSDFVYLYYGNQKATAGDDRSGTYDANQSLVYHFNDANGIASDATAYRNEPTQFGAALTTAALIGGGARFDGTKAVHVGASPSLRVTPANGFTVSAWLRFEAPQQDANVVASDPAGGFVLGLDGAKPYARVAGTSVTAPDLPLNEWHHLAVRVGGGMLELLVDGAVVASTAAQAPELAGALVVGQSAGGANGYIGELDELEVANTARPAEWLKAAAKSQGINGGMLVYGGDAQRESSGGGESYFATTIRNVTVDGWVVIGILGVMFAVSVWVILAKAIALSRIERENRRFLNTYRDLGTGDPLALAASAASGGDATERFRVSTLFPLYEAGVREVQHRLRSPAVGAQRTGFTSETIGAIRATVDAVFVRQRQRLNNKMVFLTIAISGGPFLGLLGTVVGVMVTFAAIAASGDVNVNAIAPGIAAALVATVAGLGVAIPALFAYNWLGSRIKDVDAETHVFADEFVNKLAEHYV